MTFFLLILLLIIFSSARAEKPNEFNKDYISRDSSNIIKGIFVILIFFKHTRSYIALNGAYDAAYAAFQNHIDQMVVVMFLFYSGYGMMEQIKKRGYSYIKTIPQKRFPSLLLNFDLAVLMFLAADIYVGRELTVKQVLIALTAWEPIGNSNWYIGAILIFYVLTFISFIGLKWLNKRWHQAVYLILLTALIVVYIYLAKYKLDRTVFWYNTALVYVLGFWYSFFKDTIEKILMKSDIIYLIAIAVMTLAYIFTYLHRDDRLMYYILWSFAFTLIAIVITMKVSIKSNILAWFGEHIFSIFILQRLPMMVLNYLGVADRHKYIFVVVSFALTCAISVVFDYLTELLTKAIWKPKRIEKIS